MKKSEKSIRIVFRQILNADKYDFTNVSCTVLHKEVFGIEMDQTFKEKWLDDNVRKSLVMH